MRTATVRLGHKGLGRLIGRTRELHRTNWETVEQAIAGERPLPFDHHFDFVLAEVGRLQPLWQV